MPPLVLSGRRDAHLTDDSLYALLRAADGADVALSEVCASHGLSIPEYCVLKKKYGGLSLEDLRGARERDARLRTRTLALTASAAVTLVSAALGVYAAWGRDTPVTAASAASPHALARPAADGRSDSARRGANTPPAATISIGPLETKSARSAGVSIPHSRPTDRVSVQDDEGYAVQVAALPDAHSARVIADQLTASGYPAFVRAIPVGSGEAHRVRVGPFHTRRQAEQLLPELVRGGYEHAWITK